MVDVREVFNGLTYLSGSGCQWSAIPRDFPPKPTIHDYLDRWTDDRTLERIHHVLYVGCRELDERKANPTAAVIDSQSVRGVEEGARIDPPGYDAGKKVKGRKRHILVDTTGLMLHALVHSDDLQDRDGGPVVMATPFRPYPFLLKFYADGGYQGPVFRNRIGDVMLEVDVGIVKRSDRARGFVVLPKRWVVERTFAWLGRCLRLAKDWECLNPKAWAFLLLASIHLMVRRLCKVGE